MTEETGEAIDARARLVAWARGELGEQDPNKYYRIAAPQFADGHHEHDTSWCGIFCLAGLIEQKLTDWQWITGKGFVFRLPKTADPQPGDIAVFHKGADGRDVWHHAFFERIEYGKTGPMLDPATAQVPVTIHSIDGNTMTAPKEGVTERRRMYDRNVTFYSIAPLLRDTLRPPDHDEETQPDPVRE